MGKKIEFVKFCPRCGSELDLNVVNVQCHNKKCPSIIIGNIINYCNNLRIKNIGTETIKVLVDNGLIVNGIIDLYHLKNKTFQIETLNGFGKLKTRTIVNEIEAKRQLYDYEFFGAIGINGLSTKTFKEIFKIVDWNKLKDVFKEKKFSDEALKTILITINGIGEKKAALLIDYLMDNEEFLKVRRLINELKIVPSINNINIKPIAVISGFRDPNIIQQIENLGYEVSDSWTKKAKVLYVRKNSNGTPSKKEQLAIENQIPIKYIEV